MKKKFLGIIMSAVLSAAVLTGCGITTEGDASSVESEAGSTAGSTESPAASAAPAATEAPAASAAPSSAVTTAKP